MKLKNKKTGEIGKLVLNINPNRESYSVLSTENGDTVCGNLVIADYSSLAELNEEWEDAPEEPKDFWYIDDFMIMCGIEGEFTTPDLASFTKKDIKKLKAIGNHFETKEEAEKAVEKLKAWKRLKDNGFKIEGIRYRNNRNYIEWSVSQKVRDDHFIAKTFNDDLHLLFGGEE